MEQQSGEGRWSLTVDQHAPGTYEGANRCSLTFLYLSIDRLLFQKRLEH